MSKFHPGTFLKKWIAPTGVCATLVAGLILLQNGTEPPAAEATAAERLTEQHAALWRHENLDQALAEAQRTGKPVLIDFAAEWCPPCRMMEKYVWPQNTVQSKLRNDVVPLRVTMDGPEVPAEAVDFAVGFLPTILLISPDGTEIARIGYADPDDLVTFISSHTGKVKK